MGKYTSQVVLIIRLLHTLQPWRLIGLFLFLLLLTIVWRVADPELAKVIAEGIGR